jgi:hypothetical protein
MTELVSAPSVMFQPALDPILSESDFFAHYIILIGLESKTWFTATDYIITLQ